MVIQFTDTIQMKISPIRVAWILNVKILDPKIIREIVALNTRLWGGFQNVFIYSEEGLIPDFWVNYLIKYDPDIIVIYGKNTDDQNVDRGSIEDVKRAEDDYFARVAQEAELWERLADRISTFGVIQDVEI